MAQSGAFPHQKLAAAVPVCGIVHCHVHRLCTTMCTTVCKTAFSFVDPDRLTADFALIFALSSAIYISSDVPTAHYSQNICLQIFCCARQETHMRVDQCSNNLVVASLQHSQASSHLPDPLQCGLDLQVVSVHAYCAISLQCVSRSLQGAFQLDCLLTDQHGALAPSGFPLQIVGLHGWEAAGLLHPGSS